MTPDQERDSARSRSDPSDQRILSCRIGTLLGSSVWSVVRAGLAAPSARLCVPARRGAAGVRGDHGRRAGGTVWRQQEQLLRTVPAIGPVVSLTLLADGTRARPAQSTAGRAALAGVAPHAADSGQSQGRRLIWGGRASVRAALLRAGLTPKTVTPEGVSSPRNPVRFRALMLVSSGIEPESRLRTPSPCCGTATLIAECEGDRFVELTPQSKQQMAGLDS